MDIVAASIIFCSQISEHGTSKLNLMTTRLDEKYLNVPVAMTAPSNNNSSARYREHVDNEILGMQPLLSAEIHKIFRCKFWQQQRKIPIFLYRLPKSFVLFQYLKQVSNHLLPLIQKSWPHLWICDIYLSLSRYQKYIKSLPMLPLLHDIWMKTMNKGFLSQFCRALNWNHKGKMI